jgi:hypothetical protein
MLSEVLEETTDDFIVEKDCARKDALRSAWDFRSVAHSDQLVAGGTIVSSDEKREQRSQWRGH